MAVKRGRRRLVDQAIQLAADRSRLEIAEGLPDDPVWDTEFPHELAWLLKSTEPTSTRTGVPSGRRLLG